MQTFYRFIRCFVGRFNIGILDEKNKLNLALTFERHTYKICYYCCVVLEIPIIPCNLKMFYSTSERFATQPVYIHGKLKTSSSYLIRPTSLENFHIVHIIQWQTLTCSLLIQILLVFIWAQLRHAYIKTTFAMGTDKVLNCRLKENTTFLINILSEVRMTSKIY